MSYGHVPAPASPSYVPSPPGWMARNWKWFVPSLLLSLVLLFAAFVVGVLGLVFGSMKSSTPYRQAVSAAETNPAVVSSLGAPVRPGFWLSGNINVQAGGTGDAQLEIPLTGSHHSGTIFVVAKKSGDVWRFETLEVEVEGASDRIQLLDKNPPGEK